MMPKPVLGIILAVTNNFFCKSFLPIVSCSWSRIRRYLYSSNIQLVELSINDYHLSFRR